MRRWRGRWRERACQPLDVLREAKRPAPILPQVARHPLAGLLAQSFAPLPFLSRLLCSSPCPRAPWPSHPRSTPCSASLTLAFTFLSAAAVVAPLLFLPADAAAVTARQLLEFPPPRMCQQGQRGKGRKQRMVGSRTWCGASRRSRLRSWSEWRSLSGAGLSGMLLHGKSDHSWISSR